MDNTSNTNNSTTPIEIKSATSILRRNLDRYLKSAGTMEDRKEFQSILGNSCIFMIEISSRHDGKMAFDNLIEILSDYRNRLLSMNEDSK